jgi:hypothetical protein
VTDQDLLRSLADRVALIERINDYAYGCDFGDWELLASCFAEDGVADYGEYGGRCEGPRAVVDFVRAALSGLDGSEHLFSNHSVKIDGDTAHMRAYAIAQHYLLTATGSNTYTVGLVYYFDFVRVKSDWLIKLLTLAPTWREGNPGIFAEAKARREASDDPQESFRRAIGLPSRPEGRRSQE